ncbi:MAG: MFS transporter [Alphaproteobacteria bacterium]
MNKEGERPGGPRSLLADRDFLRLWAAGGFANAVRWLEILAAGVFAFDQTGSGLMVAVVTAARTLPMLLLGAVAGAVAEAVDRKALLIAGQITIASSAATLCALALTGQIRIWHIVAGGAVSGLVWASELAVRRRMLGEVAGPLRVAQAVALDTVTSHLTRMAGPVVGGLLLESIGIGGVYLLSAVLFLSAAAVVAGLRYEQARRPLAIARIPADIAEGFATARRRPAIMAVLGVTIVMNAFGFSYTAMIPPIGRQEFGVSAALVGLLVSAEAGGGLIGGLVLASGRVQADRGPLFVGGTVLLFVCVAAAAVAPWYALALALLFVGGLGASAFATMQSTLMMTEAPAELRSRLMGILTVCIGSAPLGILAVGELSEHVGHSTAMLTMALTGLVLLAIVCRIWPIGRG